MEGNFPMLATNPKSYWWIFVLILHQEEKTFYHVRIMSYCLQLLKTAFFVTVVLSSLDILVSLISFILPFEMSHEMRAAEKRA